MITQNSSSASSAFAAIVAFSTLLVNPIYQSLLPAHIIFILLTLAWILFFPFRSLPYIAVFLLIFAFQLLVITQMMGLGDRVIIESAKFIILIFGVGAAMEFYQLSRRALFYFSIMVPVALVIYIFLAADPFAYGGRLGIALASGEEGALISSNTIGFALNICICVLLAYRPRWFVMLLPLFLTLIYLTFSRGALLSLGLIGLVYFLRTRRIAYVVILGLVCLLLLVDMNTDVLTQAFRLDDVTGSGRTLIYTLMWETMTNNPATFLVGNGPGAVDYEIYRGKLIVSAHNGYLEMLYTFGLGGILMAVFFLGKVARNFWVLPLESLLLATVLASYALSEDLMGSHNILPIGLILGIVLSDLRSCARKRQVTRAVRLPRTRTA